MNIQFHRYGHLFFISKLGLLENEIFSKKEINTVQIACVYNNMALNAILLLYIETVKCTNYFSQSDAGFHFATIVIIIATNTTTTATAIVVCVTELWNYFHVVVKMV